MQHHHNQDEPQVGQAFTCRDGTRVMLDRRAPGGAWIVADWVGGAWAFLASTVRPGDLAERFAA